MHGNQFSQGLAIFSIFLIRISLTVRNHQEALEFSYLLHFSATDLLTTLWQRILTAFNIE